MFMSYVHDLGLGGIECHTTGITPSAQLVKVLLKRISSDAE